MGILQKCKAFLNHKAEPQPMPYFIQIILAALRSLFSRRPR